jgi:hypothetical protein
MQAKTKALAGMLRPLSGATKNHTQDNRMIKFDTYTNRSAGNVTK